MSILADVEIIDLCEELEMITPYERQLVREVNGNKVISYGPSSYGYDIRCADEFEILDSLRQDPLDPKKHEPERWRKMSCLVCTIPAHGFCLTRSVETFKMPEDVLGICVGKSTYARLGLVVNVTPLEPGWAGHLTIELSNTTDRPLLVYANEGIAQVVFYQGDVPPATTYATRSGKYMNQVGIVHGRV